MSNSSSPLANVRWGKVDGPSAAVALGITIPLALIFTCLVLWMGWFFSENNRGEIRGGGKGTLFQTRGNSARFQTGITEVGVELSEAAAPEARLSGGSR